MLLSDGTSNGAVYTSLTDHRGGGGQAGMGC